MTHDSTGWATPASQIPAGTRLNGIYEIDHPIGAGGMGEIYKGHAIQTGDAVAIKVIRPDLGENDAALGLFRKEASVLHNLLHEAIVRYYVFSVDPAIGRPYLAMEFVDGPSLSEVLGKGPLAYESVRMLQRRLAGGLQCAHELGVVHRDVSPDNVILPASDVTRAKIIDFGIARTAQIGGGTIIGGGFAGKHNYCSPEQLGLFGGEVTAKSDIYSLGLVLAEALSGRALDMSGTQVQLVEKRRTVPDLAHIDARMRPLVEWMLQPDPADRPESMADVAEWRSGTPTILPRPGTELSSTQFGRALPEEPEPRRRSGLRALAAGLGALAVLALAAAGLYWAASWQQPEEALPDVAMTEADRPNVEQPRPEGPVADADTESITSPSSPSPAPDEAPVVDTGSAVEPGPVVSPVDPQEGPAPAAPPEPSGPEPEIPVLAARPDAAAPADFGSSPQPGTENQPAPPVARPEIAPQPEPPIFQPEVAPETDPPVAAPEPLTRVAEVTSYLRGYEGGACFFAASPAVTETGDSIKASVEVFGSSVAGASALDADFKEANGFEAQIFLRQVSEAQCPVVDFLDRLGARADMAPEIAIAADQLRAGQSLKGTVAADGNRNLELLLVSAEGMVENVSSGAQRGQGGASFDIRLEGAPSGSAEPQLLLALTTDEPLALPSAAVPAAEYFAQALAAAERSDQPIGVAVKYFKAGG